MNRIERIVKFHRYVFIYLHSTRSQRLQCSGFSGLPVKISGSENEVKKSEKEKKTQRRRRRKRGPKKRSLHGVSCREVDFRTLRFTEINLSYGDSAASERSPTATRCGLLAAETYRI